MTRNSLPPHCYAKRGGVWFQRRGWQTAPKARFGSAGELNCSRCDHRAPPPLARHPGRCHNGGALLGLTVPQHPKVDNHGAAQRDSRESTGTAFWRVALRMTSIPAALRGGRAIHPSAVPA